MSEQRDSFENSPAMAKVFANAGIVDEPENNNEGAESGQEKNEGNDTKGGQSPEARTNEADKVQGDAGKDSLSGKPDSGKKQGKEKEAKDAGDPNDLKLADGSIVKAGAERRHYETAQIAKQQLGQVRNELNTERQNHANLKTRYDELFHTVKSIGMEKPEDVSAAVRLYKDLNSDLPGTLKKLLAEAKALGHNFEGIGGQIDTAAVNHLLDARLPKNSQEQQQLSKEDVDRQAATEVAQFVQQYPDAVTHEAHIAALIDRSIAAGKPLSLVDAYFVLKQKVADDGLDWTKPLGPQVEARKTPQQQQQQEQKPRANGRSGIADTPLDPKDQIQPERELDSDSIVLAAMQENGFKYQR